MMTSPSRTVSIGLKPLKLEPTIVQLLESYNIVSVGVDANNVMLMALSSGEVFMVGSSGGSEKIKFSSSPISSVAGSAATGSSTTGGLMAAAMAAVVGGSGTTGRGSVVMKIDVSKIFSSTNGFFVVSCPNGDSYIVPPIGGMGYLISTSLGQLGVITAVASVAGSKAARTTTDTLVGTQNGKIFLLTSVSNPQDRLVDVTAKMVYDFGSTVRLTDIAVVQSTTTGHQCFVSTPVCVWLFPSSKSGASSGSLISSNFSISPQLVWECPISHIGSQFALHREVPELDDAQSGGPTHISWLNGVSIVCGKISDCLNGDMVPPLVVPHSTTLNGKSFTESLIGKPIDEVEKRTKSCRVGNFFSVTNYMYIVEFEGRIVGISRIQLGQCISQLHTNGTAGSPTGSSYGSLISASGGTCILTGSKRMYQVTIGNERNDVWKYFLKRQNFLSAMKACLDNVKEQAMVMKAEADFILSTGSGGIDVSSRAAATLYSKALRKSQETISPYMNDIIEKLSTDRKSLLQFLLAKIDLIGTGDSYIDVPEGVIQVQVSVLFIYICDLYITVLGKVNQDDIAEEDLESLEADFIAFISERHSSLNIECIKTVYELLESNGLFRVLVVVAESVGDIETAVRVDMELGNYLNIVRRIGGSGENMLIAFEKIAPVLFRFHPNEIVDVLIKKRKMLNGEVFFTSIVCFAGALTRDHKEAVIRYLDFWLSDNDSHEEPRHNQEMCLNVLCELKCDMSIATKDESAVTHLIESVHSKKNFNPEFFLRSVRHHKLKKSEILLLAIEGEFLKATRMALELTSQDAGIELAKQIAWRSRSRDVQRICWLEILNSRARQSCGSNELVELFRDSEILQIMDLLSVLESAGLTSLEDGSDGGIIHREIIEKLEAFDNRSKGLETEIKNYSEALEWIRSDMRTNRTGTCAILSYSQKCEICLRLLFDGGKFTVFNCCGHCFHTECLTDALTMKLVGKKSDEELDEIVSRSCVLCGEDSLLIEDIFTPFVDPCIDSAEIEMWKVV